MLPQENQSMDEENNWKIIIKHTTVFGSGQDKQAP